MRRAAVPPPRSAIPPLSNHGRGWNNGRKRRWKLENGSGGGGFSGVFGERRFAAGRGVHRLLPRAAPACGAFVPAVPRLLPCKGRGCLCVWRGGGEKCTCQEDGGCQFPSLCKAKVSAVEVYTPSDFPVENGTEAKLPCTFTSTEVISSSASVTWSFQGEGSSSPVSFFYYYNGKAYPGKSTQFDDRSNWAGDLNRKDASITIANMQFQDNGTYICDVKNPPDIVVTPGKIKVRVMEKGNLSVFPLTLVLGVTGVGILVLVFVIMLIVCVMIRKKNSKKHYSGCSTSESLMSPVKQAPRKSPSDTEVLVNSGPIRSHQGPVIYAQLDHSGGHYSDKINKSESVVYADIRKN